MKLFIYLAALFLLVITACKGTFDIGLEHSSSSIKTPSVAPQATPTFVLPTPTPLPTAAPATPENIIMPPGATAVVEQGTIQPGQTVLYTLQAGQSQPMILMMTSQNDDVTLGVFEPNGNRLLDPSDKVTHWRGLLPRTELYTIQLTGGATAEEYTLTVKVAQRVNHAPGAASITLNGTTVNGYVFSYALSGLANQTLTVTLNLPSSSAYIDIFGVAGGSLLSSTTKANTWTGVLPQTQDYVIEVIPNNGQVVDYSLTITVH